jgi:hypothetical protein
MTQPSIVFVLGMPMHSPMCTAIMWGRASMAGMAAPESATDAAMTVRGSTPTSQHPNNLSAQNCAGLEAKLLLTYIAIKLQLTARVVTAKTEQLLNEMQ